MTTNLGQCLAFDLQDDGEHDIRNYIDPASDVGMAIRAGAQWETFVGDEGDHWIVMVRTEPAVVLRNVIPGRSIVLTERSLQ